MSVAPELKIIADHLRSSSFLIADGIMPSNEGRGYVLRRILRRAMLQIHKLGAKRAMMYKLVDGLILQMGDNYPELIRAKQVVVATIKIEEEKFRETLEKGLKILMDEVKASIGKVLSGKIAFKLYDTYGFPLDLTQDILKEYKISVNLDEFESEMEEQRARARKNWVGSGEKSENTDFISMHSKFGDTKFLGYNSLTCEAKILEIVNLGEGKAAIILDQTTFYATSGGQKGDDGKIALLQNSEKQLHIFETIKVSNGLFLHLVDNLNYEEIVKNFSFKDLVKVEVESVSRKLRSSNHSATHLLHKVLKEIIGASISQKGSNVDSKYFTFDFNLHRPLTKEEILRVEDVVNLYIRQNSSVEIKLMKLEDAHKTGAEALFGEKYSDDVRVVKMEPSVELCGGTHVAATGEIGFFKIISEKGIAAGIRRIEACTGIEAINYVRSIEIEANNQRINLQQELKKKEKEIVNFKKQLTIIQLSSLAKIEQLKDINILTATLKDFDAKDLREVISELREKTAYQKAHIFAIFSTQGDKVSLCLACSVDLVGSLDCSSLIKPMITALGGNGGGGKKDFAMGGGNNVGAIQSAIQILYNELAKII